jgi:hypothetical protein
MKICNPSGKNIFFLVFLLILGSCAKDHSLEISPVTHGNIIFTFSHRVHGINLEFDTMLYSTSNGNNYEVTDLQYFISHVSLHSADGKWYEIKDDDGIHYNDARDVVSCSWWASDIIPQKSFDSITFTFGLDENQNTTGRFPDPPQRDMAWPDVLGGGYHYMKMNLKWKNDSMLQARPFMFHLGIGQVYASNTVNPDSIIGFVQNDFKVGLPCYLDLSKGGVHQVNIQMNVDQWFDGQKTFDFSAYPNGIMQNQEGMFRAGMNGRNAFSVTITN